MRMPKITQSKGIGLFEILISLMIVLSALLVLSKFGASFVRATSLIQQNIQALNLAKNQIEYFRSYETLSTTTGKLAYDDITSGSSTTTLNNLTYTMTWTVTPYSTPPAYKTVRVVVSWVDSNGTTQQIELVTMIASIDPASEGNIIDGEENNENEEENNENEEENNENEEENNENEERNNENGERNNENGEENNENEERNTRNE